ARQGAQGVGGADQGGQGSDIRPEAPAGLLAEPEPDRAAVEVPAQGSVADLARELREDAGGGGRGAGQPARLPGAVADADDRAFPPDARLVHPRRRTAAPLILG